MVKKGEKSMVTKLKKSDFNAGSPHCSWLKEEIIGEIADYKNKRKTRGLIEKHGVELFEGIEFAIMNEVASLDDYPAAMRAMAVEIIQKELDSTFKG